MDSCIRVGVVTADPILREGMVQTLRASSKLVLAAEGATVGDMVPAIGDAALDVLVIDNDMPGTASATIRAIRKSGSGTRIAVMGISDQDDHVFEAFRAGAQGYLLKEATGADLVHAIEALHRGLTYVTPLLASRLVIQLARIGGTQFSRDLARLSARERQVLGYISEGLTSREIAVKLGVSINTIKQHKMSLFSKTGIRNSVEAVSLLGNGGVPPA